MDSKDFFSCRICLENTASIPIFETKNSPDPNVYSKLCLCMGETIQDDEGFPRHICPLCHITLNTAIKFIERFKVTTKILQENSSLLPNDNGTLGIEGASETDRDSKIKYEFVLDPVKQEPEEVKDVLEPLLTNKNITIKKKALKQDRTVKKCDATKKSVTKVQKRMLRKPKRDASITDADNVISIIDKSVDAPSLTKAQKKAKKDNTKGAAKRSRQEIRKDCLCELCGKVYHELWKHKLKYHSQPEKCPQCSKTYVNKTRLKEHMRDAHSDVKPTCTHCGKTFASRRSLLDHEARTHLKKKRKSAEQPLRECKICGKRLWSNYLLLSHIRSVHTGDRPEVCTVCNKAFINKTYLKEHMLLHTGEKPYKCPVCNKGHAGRANMKSHIKHNHRLSDIDEATREALSKCKIDYLKHMKP